MARLEDLKRFYTILEGLERKLGGKLRLDDCHGRLAWPHRGVYFFFEEGEERRESGVGARVVRVGTHALTANSKTTLWRRLSQHRGTSQSGAGNHRGSIFRLLVGSAIKARSGRRDPKSWGVGGGPSEAARRLGLSRDAVLTAEHELECEVSQHIRGMPFLFVAVDGLPGPQNTRGTIERNAIALLSSLRNGELDVQSESWLGHYSDRPRVRASGLWNNDHVEEEYDLGFLELLARCAAATQPLRTERA